MINEQFFITVQKFLKKTRKKSQKNSRLFLSTTLLVVYPYSNRDEHHCVTVIYIYIFFFFLQSEARVAWISSDCFESFSPHSIDVTEGVITTRSNRMKFRLSKYFSVNQSAAPVYFSQPASADQIWKILINYSIFDCHNPLSLTSFWRRNTRKVEEQPNRLGLEWVQNWRNGDRVQNNVQTK